MTSVSSLRAITHSFCRPPASQPVSQPAKQAITTNVVTITKIRCAEDTGSCQAVATHYRAVVEHARTRTPPRRNLVGRVDAALVSGLIDVDVLSVEPGSWLRWQIRKNQTNKK